MQPFPTPHPVILADDQAIFRAGAARVLGRESDMCVVAECDKPAALPGLLSEFPGSTLLLAQTLAADMNEVSAAAQASGCSIILLTENAQNLHPVKPPAGIHCSLSRSTSSERLLDCIRRVASGEPCTELDLDEPALNDAVGSRVLDRLTPRELQIIGLVVQGHKNKQVAAALNTQEQVVKNYLRSIYDKTGVSDRLELALFVLHHSVLAEAASRASANLRVRPA